MEYIIEQQSLKYKEYPISKELKQDLEPSIWQTYKGKQLFYLVDKEARFEVPDVYDIASERACFEVEGITSRFLVRGQNLLYEKGGEKERAYLNGRVMEDGIYTMQEGDALFIHKVKIVFEEKHIRIIGAKEAYHTTLIEAEIKELPFEGFPKYKRSPRLIMRVPTTKIKLDKPPQEGKMDKKGLLQTLLPPLGMLTVTIAIGMLMGRGIYMLMSVASTMMTTVFSVVKFVQDQKETKESNKKRNQLYEAYLLKKRKEAYNAWSAEKNSFEYNYPKITDISRLIHEFNSRIYERNNTDEDFLTISVGHSTEAASFSIEAWNVELSTEKDELAEKALQIQREFCSLNKPKVIDLKRAHLGLVGEKDVLHEQLKLYISQMAFSQSYHDVQFIVIYDGKHHDSFAWMRWLPHTKLHMLNVLGMIRTERSRDQILGSMHQILKERNAKIEENKKEAKYMPHYVFIIDEPKLVMDHSIMEYLDKSGSELGFSIIYTSYLRANLPENIGTVMMLDNSKEGTLLLEEKLLQDQKLNLYHTNEIDLEFMARDLGVLAHEQGITSSIPESITFFGLYGVQHPEDLEVKRRWETNNSHQSLEVPLGVRAEDDIVFLNLHEKAHGPHGLVAGTTGSGKSEIVQSYILSLAINFHPYEVGFLLIDYKGGGMAGLFKNLPHLMGTITNLDGSESMRALASIKSELARRQRIFGEHEVNHINGYMRLFKEGKVKEPLPHLFIISDEFAELKKEQPDFMRELVSAARIGRSLGVHLILATQKPTGVVDDQIWSNSKFKLCLKVQNEGDSKEVLKTPDAANITQPGRSYLQVGNNEIYELFQSAWSGAMYIKEKEAEVTMDNRVYVVNELGQGELVNKDLSDQKAEERALKTQLDVVVDHVRKVFDGEDTVEIRKPWLPSLPHLLVSPYVQESEELDELEESLDGGEIETPAPYLSVCLGQVDIPEEQAQGEYELDFAKDGNLLYVASSGYGKTVFLTTTLISLAILNPVSALNFYILDYGNSGLMPLKNLPHTAEYISIEDEERYRKFKKLLIEEMAERKKLLAKYMVPNLEAYNQIAEQPLKAIIIAIDNFDVIREMGIEEEGVYTKFTRDGIGLGIYTIATATRINALRQATVNNFKNKIAGYNFEATEISMIVGRGSYQQSEIKGRALVKEDDVHVVQLYMVADSASEGEYSQQLKKLTDEIRAMYPGEEAPHIPVLPEELSYSMMAEYDGDTVDYQVGLDTEEVLRRGFIASASPFVIIGNTGTGKTNLLKVLLEQAIPKGTTYIFDSKNMELYSYLGRENAIYMKEPEQVGEFIEALKKENSQRKEMLEEQLEEHPGMNPREIMNQMTPYTIVIDDVDDFIEMVKPELNKVAEALRVGSGLGVSVIVTLHAAKPRGMDEVNKLMKQTANGVVLSAQGLTNIFPVGNIKDLPNMGEGLLFRNGTYRKVQIPKYD